MLFKLILFCAFWTTKHDGSFVLELATVINKIACSAIAALFLYMLRNKLIEHKLDTATWFVLLFWLTAAYTTSSLRFILPMGFAIFVNNFLYQLGG